MRLERGRQDAAAATVRRLLAEPQDPVHRSQVLPAAVDVLVGTGAVDEAATATTELAEIAASFGCGGLQAAADRSAALVAVARDDGEAGLAAGRRAAEAWARLSAP